MRFGDGGELSWAECGVGKWSSTLIHSDTCADKLWREIGYMYVHVTTHTNLGMLKIPKQSANFPFFQRKPFVRVMLST